jgi:hypothetical protein
VRVRPFLACFFNTGSCSVKPGPPTEHAHPDTFAKPVLRLGQPVLYLGEAGRILEEQLGLTPLGEPVLVFGGKAVLAGGLAEPITGLVEAGEAAGAAAHLLHCTPLSFQLKKTMRMGGGNPKQYPSIGLNLRNLSRISILYQYL